VLVVLQKVFTFQPLHAPAPTSLVADAQWQGVWRFEVPEARL
jgi:hypothetical protein